jgi:hypothetical protein
MIRRLATDAGGSPIGVTSMAKSRPTEAVYLRLNVEGNHVFAAVEDDLQERRPPGKRRVEMVRDSELRPFGLPGQLDMDLEEALAELTRYGWAAAAMPKLEQARDARDALIDAAVGLLDGNGPAEWEAAKTAFRSAVAEVRKWAVRCRDKASAEVIAPLLEGNDKKSGTLAADQYVTLDQIAACVNRPKKTLDRYLNDPRYESRGMPPPDLVGTGGRQHQWLWTTIRPWLVKTFGKTNLPQRLPPP